MSSGYKAFRALAPTKVERAKAVVGNAHQSPQPPMDDHARYVTWVIDCYHAGIKLNKVATQKKAAEYGITRQNLVKELTELAIVRIARDLSHSPGLTVPQRYAAITDLYKNQTNLSHRTSVSVLLQQYSTPAPIAYLMGVFCRADKAVDPAWRGLEPSAGNGLLTIAGNPRQFFVNEIDETRRDNLLVQHYAHVSGQDGTLPFEKLLAINQRPFDAVLTNPPFGRLADAIDAGPARIRDLDHWMAINALDAMSDTGRAAIIVGGHTEYDEEGRVKAGKNRIFLNYLYHHYNVVDTLNIDGDLYARQGTSFDVRLILIAGRKATPQGYSRLYDKGLDSPISIFEALLARMLPLIETAPAQSDPDELLLLEAQAEAEALLLLGEHGLLGITPAGKRLMIDTYGIPELATAVVAPELQGVPLSEEQNAEIFMAVAERLLAEMNKPQSAVQFSRLIGAGKPFNAITGEPFKGANAQLCRLHNHVNGFKSNQFISDYDLSVEQRTALFKSGAPFVDLMFKYQQRLYMRSHFNLETLKNFFPELRRESPDDHLPIISAEVIVNEFPRPATTIIVRDKLVANSAQSKRRRGPGRGKGTAAGAYFPYSDTIEIFPAPQFRSITHYYSVLFHEIIHATGISERVNRPYFTLSNSTKKQTDIALEEITAEVGAAFLCAEAGFLYDTAATNANYASGYAGRSSRAVGAPAYSTLLNGIAQAQRAADYVLGRLASETSYQHRMTTFKQFKTLQIEAEAEAEALLLLGQAGELGMPYMPASKGCNRLDVDTPDAMAGDVKKALDRLRERVSDVDEFVREKLGYDTHVALCRALAAEQIDAVALAIDNIERLHQGIIIGDQTGIGKGRQAAAMIRYACHQGQTPVFCTEKPNLFTDLYRDLAAIGSAHLKPFIVNSREDKSNIRDENGNVVYQAHLKEEQDRIIKSGILPDDCNFIMLTYSQMNSGHVISKAGNITSLSVKANFVLEHASGSVVILDESHNASGDSTTGKVLASIIRPAAGVVYLSATFAKRPDNMYIYAMRTAMQEANLSPEEYAYAFGRGGVALQEVVAGQLVSQGQMIRRQRGFEGISVNYITLDETAAAYGMPNKQLEHRAIADELTRLIRRIIAFQEDHVSPIVMGMDKAAKSEQADVDLAAGSKGAGVDNSPYFSKVFNIINQMLFAIKAEAVADRAIQRLREGLKPVIAFSSTMGSFVEELYDSNIDADDASAVVNADFTNVLQRGLDGVMRITVRNAFGKSKTTVIEFDELTQAGQGEYRSIQRDIRNSTSGLVLSPIDLIKQRITDAGFTVAEVTGRKLEMQLTFKADSKLEGLISSRTSAGRLSLGKIGTEPKAAVEGPVRAVGIIKVRKKENVSESFRRFNDNEVDVLLINQSGSTGASAHAVATRKVPASLVKKRVMIVLQAELDINTEVQKRGRINRTGQLLKPEYDYITSAIPAERRLMMMLQKKLKSLDANTTSNQRNSEALMQSEDFLNKYGDEVVASYLDENPAINKALGGIKDSESDIENLAHRASGRVAVLPTDGQESFYAEIIDGYHKFVRRKIERDEYDLEVTTLDLAAKPVGVKTLLIMGKGGVSAFGDSTYMEQLEVNNLRKPFKPEELTAIIDNNLEGATPSSYSQALITEAINYSKTREAYYEEFFAKKLANEVDQFTETAKFNKLSEADQAQAKEKFTADKAQGWMQKKQDALDQLAHNLNMFRELFALFQPGRIVNHPTAKERRTCCVMGISVDRKKKLPFDPKNVDILLAVASSQKIMTLGLSNGMDVAALYSIKGISADRFDAYDKPTLQNLWRIATKNSVSDRTLRYIVTGNLLQAYKTIAGGKIVTFTTFDERQRRGILMPDGFNPQVDSDGKANAGPQEVDVPVLKALKIIKALPLDKTVTGSHGLTIRKKSYSDYQIIVPQGRGKSLFTDPNLIGLMQSQDGFNKVSNNMVGEFSDQDLEDVCFVLQTMHGASIKVLETQLSLIASEINDNKGSDFVQPLPDREEPAPQPLPPVDDEADMQLLMLEAEAEAEALLLLQLEL